MDPSLQPRPRLARHVRFRALAPPGTGGGAAPVVLVALGLLACGRQQAPPPPPPPSEVSVLAVQPRSVEDRYEFVGEVQPLRRVDVRAQVSGVILERPFREGSEVRANDVLYRIDPRTYDAALRGARARLASAQARLANARLNAARLRPLLADNAVARQDVDNAEAELAESLGAVEDARASVEQARKDLDDTVVRARIAGRVGRATLDVGTRVTGPGDVLTTIDVVDPVYVSFHPSAQQQLAWKRDPASARALRPAGSVRVQALLPDGTALPQTGRIGFVDPVVDMATGTQQYRAEFHNAQRLLVPGQFVRVRLQGITRDGAILVPQRAVLQQLGRQSVYVVGAGNKASPRDVVASEWVGDQWLIERGLAAGDRVIVDGVQKVGPGAVVRPVPVAAARPAQPGDVASSDDEGAEP